MFPSSEILGWREHTAARSAGGTDEEDGDRRDDKGRAEEVVKLRRQPAAIEQGAARKRRKYRAKAADADRPPHAGGSHRSRIQRWPDGIEARHRRVRDDAEQQRRPERDVQLIGMQGREADADRLEGYTERLA
jgi:hypothetical protein